MSTIRDPNRNQQLALCNLKRGKKYGKDGKVKNTYNQATYRTPAGYVQQERGRNYDADRKVTEVYTTTTFMVNMSDTKFFDSMLRQFQRLPGLSDDDDDERQK